MEELNEHLKERAEQLIEQNDQLRKKSEQLQEKVYLLSEADEISDLLEGRYTISNHFNNFFATKIVYSKSEAYELERDAVIEILESKWEELMEDIAKIQTDMAVPGLPILEVSASEDSEESGDDS